MSVAGDYLTITMEYEGRRFHLKLMPDASPLNFPANTISWFCCDDTFHNLEESVGFAFGPTQEDAILNYFINLELAMDTQYKTCDEVLKAGRKKRRERRTRHT